ncbi:MAG: GNAT family N-acetyltransferase [Gammaproteobacteria bacterium]|nr:GNAT family N-acetyltransferase [Gammaproteobacteria bacterium]
MKVEFLADHLDCRDKIASWFMKEWGERYPERNLACWVETQTYINKDKLPLTLIAIENDEIIGTVCLRSDGMITHSEWKAWLSYLYVPALHRGKGIAKTLVRQAELIATGLGISELHLFTRMEKPKLYIDIGWKLVGTENYRGGHVTIMSKNVDVKQ